MPRGSSPRGVVEPCRGPQSSIIIIMETERETEEEMGKRRTREEEKEENVTVRTPRRCVGLVSAEAFDFFSQGEDLESCGVSWRDLL